MVTFANGKTIETIAELLVLRAGYWCVHLIPPFLFYAEQPAHFYAPFLGNILKRDSSLSDLRRVYLSHYPHLRSFPQAR